MKRWNFNRDHVIKIEGLGALIVHHFGERRDLQQAANVTHDGAGLLAVGGNDHKRAAFTDVEIRAIVEETCEKDGDNSHAKGFASTAPADQERFLELLFRPRRAPRAILIKRKIVLRHGNREQRAQQGHPCAP